MRNIRSILCIAALGCQGLQANSIYVYDDPSGNRHYADRPIEAFHSYRLVKTYEADDYFGSVNRPAATEVRMTDSFTEPLSSVYDSMILEHARKYGLDPALLKAIVHVESGFRPDAVSSKGAVGLMQLMPETAKHYGVVTRTDPVESLVGGCRYILDLLDRFDSNLDLTLAAYNAGESAVAKYSGIPPFPETTQYIDRVKELLAHYRKNLDGA